MKHIPHLVVGAPWPEGDLQLTVVQWRHLTKVLRKHRGDPVTYTDGLGRLGSGRLGNLTIERGEEQSVERGREVRVAAAPPANKDRQRILVEKLTELGVSRLDWLRTENGTNRVSSPPKVFSWVLAAVEQSRGAWLMEVGPDLVEWSSLGGDLVVCDASGSSTVPGSGTLVVGPEGGWAPDEVPATAQFWSLGPTVLRVETAAIVAAARVLAV